MTGRLRKIEVDLWALKDLLAMPENFNIQFVRQTDPRKIELVVSCDQFQEVLEHSPIPLHGYEIAILEDGTRIGKMSS